MKRAFKKLKKWDATLSQRISQLHGRRPVDIFMYAVSHFGYGYTYPLIFLVIVIFNWNLKLIIPAGFVSFALEHTTHKFLKNKTRRTRPFEVLPIRNLMRPLDAYSFPSGHAASAFVMATLLNHLYPFLVIPLYFFASIIAISRVYNGLHYPSDIMAGSAIGFARARLGLIIFF